MRTEDIRACEGIVRDLPKMQMSLGWMERATEGGGYDCERVQGGSRLPAAVRLSENRMRDDTQKAVERMKCAIDALDGRTKEIVVNVYILGMKHEDAAVKLGMNRRTLSRRCREAMEEIAPDVLPLYGKVIAWRDEWENSIVRAWT